MKILYTLANCVVVATFAVSCSNSGSTSGSFETSKDSFDTVEALQEAYQSEGGNCPTLSPRDPVDGQSSADCDDDTVLTVYESTYGPELNVLALMALKEASSRMFDIDLSDPNLVYGKNWLINDTDSTLRKKFVDEFNGQEVLVVEPTLRDQLISDVMAGTDGAGFSSLISQCSKVPTSADQTSVSFDTEGEDDYSGDSLLDVYCSLSIIGAPDYVFDLIGTTRALDGRQTESWGKFRATWSYHPDSGLQLLIVVQA